MGHTQNFNDFKIIEEKKDKWTQNYRTWKTQKKKNEDWFRSNVLLVNFVKTINFVAWKLDVRGHLNVNSFGTIIETKRNIGSAILYPGLKRSSYGLKFYQKLEIYTFEESLILLKQLNFRWVALFGTTYSFIL